MGPVYKIAHGTAINPTKRTIKYLGVCNDARLQLEILKRAPDPVYKSICNAFFNVAENPDINLSPKQRRVLIHHQPIIRKILAPKVKLRAKRRIIQRGGGFFLATLLPAVISTALSFLGSTFIKKE